MEILKPMKNLILLGLFLLPFSLLAQEATTTIEPESASAKQAQSQLLEGDLKMDAKQYKDAALHYSEAINLNKDLICAYVYRAKAYLKLGESDKACQDLKKANELGCWRPELEGLLEKCK